MIVDLIGLPGAGKSTVARAATSLLEQQGVGATHAENDGAATLDGRRRVGWEARRFKVASVVGHPALAATCAAFAVGPLGRQYVPMLLNLCQRDRELRGAKPTGVVLLHESSLHRLCITLACLERTSAAVVGRFLAHMTWPDLVVHVKVEPQLAHTRARERMTDLGIDHGVPAIADEAWVRWRERYETAADHVLRVMERSRPVLQLDGATSVTTLAVEIARWVRANYETADVTTTPAPTTRSPAARP